MNEYILADSQCFCSINTEHDKLKVSHIKQTILSDNGFTKSFTCKPKQVTLKHLNEIFPELKYSKNKKDLFADIFEETARLESNPPENYGYSIDTNGINTTHSGNHIYVLGHEIIGDCDREYIIDDSLDCSLLTEENENPIPKLCTELLTQDKQVLLCLAFILTTFLRSWIRKLTPSWQAVLAITGKQGMGKTTLARRFTDCFVDSENYPALQFSAGSSQSAIRDALVSARDLPLVIDDLCLSASRNLERKYKDLCAQFVREGTNESPIIKKNGSKSQVKLHCNAGVIITAEFSLENPSDITRTIYIRIDNPLGLSDSINSQLIGSSYKQFIKWFLENTDFAATEIQKALKHSKFYNIHPRVCNNFTIIEQVFQLFIECALQSGLSENIANTLRGSFIEAANYSLSYQKDLLDQIDMKKKKGNIAAVLLTCYENDIFNLCHDIDKLYKHDGIIWKSDLCLKKEALEYVIRKQDGYQNYTITQIVRDLKDYGALVIQEDSTLQVKLSKKAPRVYRIKLDALKEYYEEF